MNGSTDVRSNSKNSTSATRSPAGGRTDTPMPLDTPVNEVGTSSRSASSSDRMISGIDLIDYSAGGLLPNKVYLVKGGVGVGKSILGLQFLTRGLEHQEPGILITDQKPENVIAQARSIGFPIEDAIKRNQLSILNPSGRYFELVESPADVQAIVEELGEYVRNMGARRLVIDPIYTLINTQYSSHFALMVTQSLLNALEELPTTTFLVAGGEDNAELTPIVRMLEQNVHGVVALSADQATGGRLMRLTKMRHASTENMSAHYRILNGRGIMNYRGEGETVADVTKPWEETNQISRKVLIIGAQPETIRRAKESLGNNYEVQAESDLKAGVERARRDKPGLVLVTPSRSAGSVGAVLDLARDSSSAIAFLSPANNRQTDKILYLRAGADDFITEPFNPAEFRARVEALVRRSGRRLNTRDSGLGSITSEELAALGEDKSSSTQRNRSVMKAKEDQVSFDPEFDERLKRNISTVSKFDTPFALYWIKSHEDDQELSQSLAKICRQEDILCHNRNGEFVALLTGTDQNGIRGFESRLDDKLGKRVDKKHVHRGFKLYGAGEGNEASAR